MHAIMARLVSHAANILTRKVRGVDGLTAYQRVRGKLFSYKLIGLADRCRYKLASKAPQDSSGRWSQGVYIGRDRMTGQYILFDYEKIEICKARTHLRVPYSQTRCKLSVAKLTATPFPFAR